VKASFVAVPATTLKVSVAPAGSEGLLAEPANVTEPASAPVTVFVATPLDAIAVPKPVTTPVPAVFANVTDVELSLVTVFPAASLIVAVNPRVDPDTKSTVDPVKSM
jgi:hypothetical protein